MKKIKILSDLHIEFQKFDYIPSGEDILILAGDVHVRNQHEDFISQIPKGIEILFVKGNHETYGGIHEDVIDFFKGLEKKSQNFHFLENSSYEIDDLVFFGGTGYTDFCLYGKESQYIHSIVAQNRINDFLYSKKRNLNYKTKTFLDVEYVPGFSTWSAEDHLNEHKKFVKALRKFLYKDYADHPKKIVVSHFLPSEMSIDPKYAGSNVNPYFAANLERFFGKSVPLFVHGHTHRSSDYVLKNTRVICNPKGYRGENRDFDLNLIVEIL